MLFAIVLFFYLVPEGTPKVTYWVITVGGTVISMLVGWWLAAKGGKEGSELAPPGGPEAGDAAGTLD